ncbi:MAG: alpha-L-fucosidase [Candidatus Hydrogenedentes bacterium]|nr:alpha-L-fucosidase [Candidatus Hydrogenedentota bacterium]
MSALQLSYAHRMKWFHEARFGMFVHWGLYSILGRGEWAMYVERIPKDEYAQLAGDFVPGKFDADSLVRTAADAGMKYMVLTTRHHDGFCLFDSKVSDFTSVKTAAKRDFVAEYVEACRKHGMKIGFYYSLLDWRYPGYWEPEKYPDSARAMIEQYHEQVRELLHNYGHIDILWYDGDWPAPGNDWERAKFWESKKVNSMARRIQPHIIINNRSGTEEDLDTPEQHVTASKHGRGWESCMTMGDSCGWGYIHNNPNMKTVTQLLQNLVTAAAGEGNYLLNVGPKADGAIRKEELERLHAVGEWMRVHGEAIHGSERCALEEGMIGKWTRRGNTAYLHIFRWPGKEATIPLVKTAVKSATLLTTGKDVSVHHGPAGHLVLGNLPKSPPDPHVNVIKVEFEEEPATIREKDKSAWLVKPAG